MYLNKINRLQERCNSNIHTQEGWFKNLTDVVIPSNVSTFLALGKKFSVPVSAKEIPINKLITDVEDIISKTPENGRDILRNQITNIITNHIHKNQNIKFQTDKMYKDTKRFLKDNPELVILDSDKGSVTVVMKIQEYEQKMYTLINSNSFKTIQRDPTTTVQNKSNQLITALHENGYIDQPTSKKLKKYNAICPKIYGNPKIHKDNTPLRPIVASIQSPTSSISEFLAGILKNAYETNNEYYIRNSFEFAEVMNNFMLPQDHVLVSLDVINLYGNIYKELVIKVLNLKWNSIREHTTIPRERFLELVSFVLDNNYFTFQGNYYLQVFGCAMGSKLSPIISQFVMDYVLDECIKKLPFDMVFIKKYVDDLIMSIPAHHEQILLDTFNSLDSHIQFTLEREDDSCSVPFLDTKVCRYDNIIKLDWFKKKTSSNKLIHYQSDHSIKIKINLIKEMKNRIYKICHPTFIEKNMRLLFKILLENSYPKYMIRKLLFESPMTSTVDIPPAHPPNSNVEVNNTIYCSIPNIFQLTGKIKNCFKEENVKIASYNIKTIGKLYSKLKDPIPHSLQSNIVYKIHCSNCEGTYVGHTSQWLKSRLSLHRSDIRNENQRCALAAHALQSDHNIDYENVEILDKNANGNKRKILEMIYINKQENPLNKKTDTQHLSNIYSYLLSSSTLNFYDGPVDE